MFDSFVFFTPVLLLPIALLFFFVGCSALLDFDSADVLFHISFYVTPDRLDHDFVFNIFLHDHINPSITDSGTVIVDEVGIDNEAFQVSHQFTDFVPIPWSPVTLSCEVIDNIDNTTVIKRSAECQSISLDSDENYVVVFIAGVSDNGIEPNDSFEFCTSDNP